MRFERWQREFDAAANEAGQKNVRVPARMDRMSLQLDVMLWEMEDAYTFWFWFGTPLVKPKPDAEPKPEVEPPPLPRGEAYPPDPPPARGLEEAMRTPPGMPGGLCWGAVRGQTLVARDRDPNVQLALTRECIGGNGSGSRQ
jgi:hypothetical protein